MSKISQEILDERLALYHQGMSDRDIAHKQGVTITPIADWRKVRGLPRQAQRITREEEARRRSLYHLGLSDNEIGAQLGIHRDSVRRWRKYRGLESAYPPRKVDADDRRAWICYHGMRSLYEMADSLQTSVSEVQEWFHENCLTPWE